MRPRWIAYQSNESGQAEIYVQPFTAGAEPNTDRMQISTEGGAQSPRWRRDGRELFYLAAGKLIAVEVKPGRLYAVRCLRRWPAVPFRYLKGTEALSNVDGFARLDRIGVPLRRRTSDTQ